LGIKEKLSTIIVAARFGAIQISNPTTKAGTSYFLFNTEAIFFENEECFILRFCA